MRAGYRWTRGLAPFLAVAAVGAAACGGGATAAHDASPQPSATAGSPSAASAPSVDPATVKANELGVVPVLMYHQFVAQPKGIYDQTPSQLKAELTRLYHQGYRTITAASFVAGKIDVPAGKSPMVLTFDDATTSQYGELPDGSVDPKSALGILLAVGKANGEDHPVATFYVNDQPFAGRFSYLKRLHDLGMEIGDHTLTHANLGQLTDDGVQAEIAKNLTEIERAVPGIDVTTMALPLGVHPKNRALAAKGRYGATPYRFQAVMLVGAGPAPSPFSAKFKALGIPRLLSGHDKSLFFGATYWLNRIGATRYISDGDPEHISFPKAAASKLSPRFASMARPY
ncbi:MAG: polysaccharide deacetylase [Frankiales bacterium]|nr:polysaccharide deacetylase [Frankiales bacterium]